ncbi:MAG: ABC transporter ATP-binding protein [Asgard group archaeon]|nr:ABC transporter ATP-binding protein [Asgard group archaeon]
MKNNEFFFDENKFWLWGSFFIDPIRTREKDKFQKNLKRKLETYSNSSLNFEEITSFLLFNISITLESINSSKKFLKNNESFFSSDFWSTLQKEIKLLHESYCEDISHKQLTDLLKNRELKESTNLLLTHLQLSENQEEKFQNNFTHELENISNKYQKVISNTPIFINQLKEYSEICIQNSKFNFSQSSIVLNFIDELIMVNFSFNYLIKTKKILKKFIDTIIADDFPLIKKKTKNLEQIVALLKGKSFEVLDNLHSIRRQLARQDRAKKELDTEIPALSKNEFGVYIHERLPENIIKELINLTDDALDLLDNWFQLIRDFENSETKITGSKLTNHEKEKILSFFIQMELLRNWSEFFYDITFYTIRKGQIVKSPTKEKKKFIDTDAVLVARDIFKTYKLPASRVYALRGINLEIQQGEFLAIMGPSGAGKTTLINILTGLDSPDKGAVYLNGQNIALMEDKDITVFRRDEIGLVFQFYQLFGELTALENVSMPAEMAGIPPQKARQKALDILKIVDLEKFAQQYPDKLSGGQQQRVAIARSLINSPSIVVADQLTGDLDSTTGKEIIGYLRKINEEEGTTILLVTHNKDVAKQADRILRIEDGEIIEEIDMKILRQAELSA